MKQEYLNSINELLEDCNDFEILEIIRQLLVKSNQIERSTHYE